LTEFFLFSPFLYQNIRAAAKFFVLRQPLVENPMLSHRVFWWSIRDSSWFLQGNLYRLVCSCLAKALAVPEKICASLPQLCLIFIDRCAFLALLHPPRRRKARQQSPLKTP
jgi:hypothetical protein